MAYVATGEKAVRPAPASPTPAPGAAPQAAPSPASPLGSSWRESCSEDEPAARGAARTGPGNKRASWLTDTTARKEDALLSAREPPKAKPKLKGRRAPCQALRPKPPAPLRQASPCVSCQTTARCQIQGQVTLFSFSLQ